MLRQSRIAAPGALHHVMIRGIEAREIFHDVKERGRADSQGGRVCVEPVLRESEEEWERMSPLPSSSGLSKTGVQWRFSLPL